LLSASTGAEASMAVTRGRIEREGLVSHVIAQEVVDLTERLADLSDGAVALPHTAREPGAGSWKTKSRDFH
jgi:error-prone DNA polymerase